VCIYFLRILWICGRSKEELQGYVWECCEEIGCYDDWFRDQVGIFLWVRFFFVTSAYLADRRVSTSGSKSFGTSSSGRSGLLPVFISKETSRKRDSLDSFTNFSTSDVDYKEGSFKEKSFNGEMSFGALSLNDVGGALADCKEDKLPSSSSASIMESPSDTIAPAFPEPAVTKDELTIEISSVRYPSMISASIPSPTLTVGSVPKHPIDAPLTVGSSQSQAEHLV